MTPLLSWKPRAVRPAMNHASNINATKYAGFASFFTFRWISLTKFSPQDLFSPFQHPWGDDRQLFALRGHGSIPSCCRIVCLLDKVFSECALQFPSNDGCFWTLQSFQLSDCHVLIDEWELMDVVFVTFTCSALYQYVSVQHLFCLYQVRYPPPPPPP